METIVSVTLRDRAFEKHGIIFLSLHTTTTDVFVIVAVAMVPGTLMAIFLGKTHAFAHVAGDDFPVSCAVSAKPLATFIDIVATLPA